MLTSRTSLVLLLTTTFAAACSSSSGQTGHTTPPGDGGTDADDGAADASEEPSQQDSGSQDSGAGDAPGDSPMDAGDSAPTGCGAQGDSAAPITVHGRVVSALTGGGTQVQVTIGSQTTMSAANGNFTLGCVVPPYDIIIDDPVADRHQAYAGLTRPDPTVGIYSYQNPMPPEGYGSQAISGSLTEGGSTIDAGMSNAYMAIMDGETDLGDTHGSTFDFITYLPTKPPVKMTLYGFTYTPSATGGATSIDALGTTAVSATGSALAGLTIPLDPMNVVASTLSGTLSLPAGATPAYNALYLGGGLTFPVTTDMLASTSFSYATFQSPLHWILDTVATLPDGSQCTTYTPKLAGNENLAVVVPAGSTVTAPSPAGMFNPATQDFTWSHVDGTVHVFTVIGNAASPAWFIVTDRDSVHFPFTLSQGTWNWSLETFAAVGNIDALTASATALQVLSPAWALTTTESNCYVSGTFTN